MKPVLRLLCIFALLAALPGAAWARGASGGGGGGRSSSGGGSRGSSGGGGSWGGSRPSSSPAPSNSGARPAGGSSWGSGGSNSPGNSGGSGSGGGNSRNGSSWGSGGSSSSGNSSSSSKDSSSASSSGRSNWGSSSRFSGSSESSSSARSGSTSNERSSSASSRTDAALGRKAGESGAKFASRGEAVRDFESKYAQNYPSTFSKEPASRPAHIPETVMVGSRPYPVQYDSGRGGYGYWDGGGWRAYEVVRDAVMLGALMRHHNYDSGYYGGYGSGMVPYGPVDAGNSGTGSFIGVACIVVLAAGAFLFIRSLR